MSERWLAAWALVLNSLSREVDFLEKASRELSFELASDRHRYLRLASDLDGIAWADLYELPNRQFFWKCLRRCLTLPQMLEVGRLTVGFLRSPERRSVNDLGGGNSSGLAQLPRVYSGFQAWNATVKAYFLCQATMSDLIAAGRAGDDDSFILAARIDPAAILAPTFQRRLHLAVAMEQGAFLVKVSNALRDPIRRELQHARLQGALLLMAKARQLSRLNENLAAELFIKRTRLYPSHGRKDAQRSLWRFIQRWKKDHATLIRGKMSSSLLRS